MSFPAAVASSLAGMTGLAWWLWRASCREVALSLAPFPSTLAGEGPLATLKCSAAGRKSSTGHDGCSNAAEIGGEWSEVTMRPERETRVL